MGSRKKDISSFECLHGQDAISARVSDHHPVLHNNILFWNVMMQGKLRRHGYNNGFAMIESDEDYQQRLSLVAKVVAEIVAKHKNIIAITLCEGPVRKNDVWHFLSSLMSHHQMAEYNMPSPLLKRFFMPELTGGQNWGLIMFVNRHLNVRPVPLNNLINSGLFDSLANRIQLWQLTSKHEEKYIALAHLPYGNAVYCQKKKSFFGLASAYFQVMEDLLIDYENKDLTVCADFNFNPLLLGRYEDHCVDAVPLANSVLCQPQKEEKICKVTVDGVLLSDLARRKYVFANNHHAFFRLQLNQLALCEKDEESVMQDRPGMPNA